MKFIKYFTNRDKFPPNTRVRLAGMTFIYLNTIQRSPSYEDGNIHIFMCEHTRKKVDIMDADFAEKVWRRGARMTQPTLHFKVQFICTGKPRTIESDDVRLDNWLRVHSRNHYNDVQPDLFDVYHGKASLTKGKRDG